MHAGGMLHVPIALSVYFIFGLELSQQRRALLQVLLAGKGGKCSEKSHYAICLFSSFSS